VVEYGLGRSNKVDEKFVEVVRRGGDELLTVPTPAGWIGDDEKFVEVVRRRGDELLMDATPASWVGDELLIVPSPARMGDGLLVLFDPRSTIRSFDNPLSAAVERPGEKERL
jgi:hypothetical protein